MKLSHLQNMVKRLPQGQPLSLEQVRQTLVQLGYDPENLYQELEMESKMADIHPDSSSSNAQVQLHSHPFYEILYCRNTCGAQYLMGTHRYRLQKGDVIIVPPGISHRPLLPETMEEPYKRYVLWVSPDFMLGAARYFPAPDVFSRCSLLRSVGPDRDALAEHFRSASRETEKQETGWESTVIGHAIIILSLLQRLLLRDGAYTVAERPELLDRVLAYVETHLAEKITLEDTAGRFWVSQSTITQTFRKQMGVSFYRCVTQRRLISAKSLIEQEIPLEDVGRRVGFSDYSTFYRAFKKEFGISPRQYRKLQHQED
jgi:AraC-like DNA-binding protein